MKLFSEKTKEKKKIEFVLHEIEVVGLGIERADVGGRRGSVLSRDVFL